MRVSGDNTGYWPCSFLQIQESLRHVDFRRAIPFLKKVNKIKNKKKYNKNAFDCDKD